MANTQEPPPPPRPPKPVRRLPSRRPRSPSPDPLLEFLPLHLLTVSASKLDTQFSIQDTTGRDAVNVRKIVLIQNLMAVLREQWDRVGMLDFTTPAAKLDVIQEEDDLPLHDISETDESEFETIDIDDHLIEDDPTHVSLDSDADSAVDLSEDDDCQSKSPSNLKSTPQTLEDALVRQEVMGWMQGLDFFSDMLIEPPHNVAEAAEPYLDDKEPIRDVVEKEPELDPQLDPQLDDPDPPLVKEYTGLLEQVFDLEWSIVF